MLYRVSHVHITLKLFPLREHREPSAWAVLQKGSVLISSTLKTQMSSFHDSSASVQMVSRAKPRSFCCVWAGTRRYSLSYRDLEAHDAGARAARRSPHDLPASVQRYAPELDKRCRPHLKARNDSWKVDETSINIKKVWTYLYRAVDSEGNTLEFLLGPTRDAQAAKRFFLKALHFPSDPAPGAHIMKEQVAQPTAAANLSTPTPGVINVDKNAAKPSAIADLKASGTLPAAVELKTA